MQLVIRLVLRLVGIAAVCLAFAVGWILVDAHRSIDRETTASAERVARQLEALYWREILWRGGLRREHLVPTPEWRTIATLEMISPGVCVTFAPGADEARQLCGQIEGVGAPAPAWFARSYAFLFGPQPRVPRALTTRQLDAGTIVALADPDAAVRQAWDRISTIAGLAASLAIAICLLTALAIAQALAPTRVIVAGLRRLAVGDYRHRLPPFGTAEFGLIGGAVNELAEKLAQTTTERVALTKRLFEVQEEERRALARDLHDEFGQCLTATVAFAGAIEAGAAQDRPEIAQDARAISRVAGRMMATLREALARLRSQDVEELGLEASLVQLVAGWNAQGPPRAAVRLDLAGEFAGVPRAVATSVYRIAQECLTNAIRHGKPSEVNLRVERLAAAEDAIALTIEDNGGGDARRINAAAGRGILGIRERVAAFGGSLSIDRAARGVRVAARIPLVATAP